MATLEACGFRRVAQQSPRNLHSRSWQTSCHHPKGPESPLAPQPGPGEKGDIRIYSIVEPDDLTSSSAYSSN